MSVKHLRLPYALVFCAVLGLAVPATAQFSGLIGNLGRSTDQNSDGCPKGKKRSVGSQLLGSVAGSLVGGAASRAGSAFQWIPIAGLTDQLTAEIACRLDPEEQKQAAQATLDATRGEGESSEVAVGTSASWTSATRADVAGSSTVVSRNDEDRDGLQCIMVSDVIIVSGEETRASKRMCRKPPAARYALKA